MSETNVPVKVLLVDDHTLFREGIAEIFAADPVTKVVGEAENGEQAVALAQRERPEVILLDVEMPIMGAEETIRQLSRVSPSSKVVILTMYDEPSLVRKLLSLGAHAYVVKSATREELLATVHTVNKDDDRVIISVSRSTLERLEGKEGGLLSSRELEVLSLVAKGGSNAQIASNLFISEGTVKRHLTNIYAKLNVASRMDAISKAMSAGLLEDRRLSSAE